MTGGSTKRHDDYAGDHDLASWEVAQFTDQDLLTWELEFRRTGSLPVDAQVALLEYARLIICPDSNRAVHLERSSRP